MKELTHKEVASRGGKNKWKNMTIVQRKAYIQMLVNSRKKKLSTP